MLACAGADSGMLVDAPVTNGPFQPVALMHLRGENREPSLPQSLLSFLLLPVPCCLCVSSGDELKFRSRRANRRLCPSSTGLLPEVKTRRRLTFLKVAALKKLEHGYLFIFFLEEEVELCVYMSVRKSGEGGSKVGSATFFFLVRLLKLSNKLSTNQPTNQPRIPVSVTTFT